MEFLDVFNAVVRKSSPAHKDVDAAGSLDDVLGEIGVDSLTLLVCSMYLCDLYGIPDSVGERVSGVTVRDVYTFISAHQSRTPSSMSDVEEVLR